MSVWENENFNTINVKLSMNDMEINWICILQEWNILDSKHNFYFIFPLNKKNHLHLN